MATTLNAERAERIPAATGAHHLEQALGAIIDRHYDAAKHAIDYGALGVSREMKTLVAAVDRLAGVDPADLDDDKARLAFWLNAWNALMLHGLHHLGQRENIRAIDGLFSGPAYRIGDYTYTLDDIEHGVLRVNARPPYSLSPVFGRRDPRQGLTLQAVDPLIHFGFYTASRSSPPLQAFGPDTVRERLRAAATAVLDRVVEIQGDRIWLPRVCYWYADDFGGESMVLRFVLRHLPDDARRQQLQRLTRQPTLEYTEYDWTLNDRFNVLAAG